MGGGSYTTIFQKLLILYLVIEFYTAYTPYQAEVAQGTLQYLYEFQSAFELSEFISNASYMMVHLHWLKHVMAMSITKNKKIFLSKSIHPSYVDVLKHTLIPLV